MNDKQKRSPSVHSITLNRDEKYKNINVSEDDLLEHIKNQITIKNYGRNYFTIGGALQKKISDDNFVDDKLIITEGLNHADIADAYLKKNKYSIFNVKSNKRNMDEYIPVNDSKSSSVLNEENVERIFIQNHDFMEDLNKDKAEENLNEVGLNCLNNSSKTVAEDTIDNTVENFDVTQKIVSKMSVSTYDSDSSAKTSSSQCQIHDTNEKYSFDSLLNTVLNQSKSNAIRISNNDVKTSSQIPNQPFSDGINHEVLNENFRMSQKMCVEEMSSKSSRSSCSIKLKVVKCDSKIEIDMNTSHNIITKEVNQKKMRQENGKCKKQIKNVKYNNQFMYCDMKKSRRNVNNVNTCVASEIQNEISEKTLQKSDEIDEVQSSNKCVDVIKNDSQFGDCFHDSKFSNNPSDTTKIANDTDTIKRENNSEVPKNTPKIPFRNWKITKPEVKQLEIFLNLVNEAQQVLSGSTSNVDCNLKGTEGNNKIDDKVNSNNISNHNNDINCNDNKENDYLNSNKNNKFSDKFCMKVKTESSSSDSYESCEDTCPGDFMDASSTVSKAETKLPKSPREFFLKENILKEQLKKEIKKCNRFLNLYCKDKSYQNNFLSNNFIIKVCPDIEDDPGNFNWLTDECNNKSQNQQKPLFISNLNNQKRDEIMTINQQDIICANFDIVVDNKKNNNSILSNTPDVPMYKNCDMFERCIDNNELFSKRKKFNTRQRMNKRKFSSVEDCYSNFMPNSYKSHNKDITSFDKVEEINEIKKIIEKQPADGKPRVVWEDEVEIDMEKEIAKLKSNIKLNPHSSSTNFHKSLDEIDNIINKDVPAGNGSKLTRKYFNQKKQIRLGKSKEQHDVTSISSKKYYSNSYDFSDEGDMENDDNGFPQHFPSNLRTSSIIKNKEGPANDSIIKGTSDYQNKNQETGKNGENVKQSYVSLQKGILKKKNLPINDSGSETDSLIDDFIHSHKSNIITNRSDDSYDSDYPIFKNKKQRKKSVSFTMPKDQEQIPLVDGCHQDFLKDLERCKQKHANIKDNNLNGRVADNSREKMDSSKEKNDHLIEEKNHNKELNTIKHIHHTLLHLSPLPKKYAERFPLQQYVLLKFSVPTIIERKHFILYKLHFFNPMEYLEVPMCCNLLSSIKLKPIRTSSSLNRINKMEKNIEYQCDVERKGYVIKLAIYHVFQYQNPVCMNMKRSNSHKGNENVIFEKTKDRKSNRQNKLLSGDKKGFVYRKMIIHSSKIVKKKPLVNDEKSSKDIIRYVESSEYKANIDNNKSYNTDEFLDYLNDIRKSLVKMEYRNHEEYFADEKDSKILFDISTRPNAILSITAHDSIGINSNDKNNSEINSDIKALQYESKGRSTLLRKNIKNKDNTERFDGYNETLIGYKNSTNLISTKGDYDLVSDETCNNKAILDTRKLERFPKFSTVNIRVGDVFKKESDNNGSAIKIIGRIIEPKIVKKIRNSFLSKHLPLCHHEADDKDETLSSETYSVRSRLGYNVTEKQFKTLKQNNAIISNKKNNLLKTQLTTKKLSQEETILNKRRNILLTKSNYTRPCPFRFTQRTESDDIGINLHNLCNKNPWKPIVTSRRCQSDNRESRVNCKEYFVMDKIGSWTNNRVFKRPQSCHGHTRQLYKKEDENFTVENLERSNDNNNFNDCSRSLDSLNIQLLNETKHEQLNKAIMDDSPARLLTEEEQISTPEFQTEEKELNDNPRSAQKCSNTFNHSKTSLMHGKILSKRKNTSRSNSSDSYKSNKPRFDAPGLNKFGIEQKKKEKIIKSKNIYCSDSVCPLECQETNTDEDNSSTSQSRQELEFIKDMATKINSIFPENSSIKKSLLEKVCRMKSNHKLKSILSDRDQNELDCFGAPIKDELGISYYNNFGKPIVNIYGCKIYDKNGIPKRGAYGKPIHIALRSKLNAALQNVEADNEKLIKNDHFEEDLISVLSTYNGLKTDLYGRVYDNYGRPLFDSFGYLLYDKNGNPLTDAYNRSLRDKKGKPLISQTICNSTNFKDVPPIANSMKKKIQLPDVYREKVNLSKPPRGHSVTRELFRTLSPLSVNIKKQISFDDCSIFRDEKRELGDIKFKTYKPLKEKINY